MAAWIRTQRTQVPLGIRIGGSRVRKRAGWLDPLVRAPWPEVDVQDYAYHHEDWMTRYAEYEGVGVDDILVTAASLNDNDSDD